MKNMDEIASFVGELEKKYDIKARKTEIDTILQRFKELNQKEINLDVQFRSDASTIIAYFYFYLLEQKTKPVVTGLANNYKIAACTELTINYVQPIVDAKNTDKSIRQINAELSVFAALAIIGGWHDLDFYLNSGIASLNGAVDTFLSDRIEIFSYLNTQESFPIMLNSQTWLLFYLIYQYYRSIPMMR